MGNAWICWFLNIFKLVVMIVAFDWKWKGSTKGNYCLCCRGSCKYLCKLLRCWEITTPRRNGVVSIVAINYIPSLICRCYGPKRDILYYWGTIIYDWLYYYVLSKDKGLWGWNNEYGKIPLEQWCQWDDSAGTMVSAENAIVVSTMVLIVRDKIIW